MGCAWCRDEDKEVLFITLDDLNLYNGEKKFIAIDCSTGDDAEAKYKLHRIKDAQFLGQKWSIAQPPKSVKECMDKLGVGTDSNVVCYDNDSGTSACIAAYFMRAFGMEHVQVLEGKFADDKNNKKAEKDQDPVKKASGTGNSWLELGSGWNGLPKTCLFPSQEMKKVIMGSTISQVIDMRAATVSEKEPFLKSAVNLELDQFYLKKKHLSVASSTVEATIADKKLKRTNQIIICGGGDDAIILQWCLMCQGFKQVTIYAASFSDHDKMVKEVAAKEAADAKKLADDKKPADDKKHADDKKTDAKPEDKLAEKPIEDATKPEEKPVENATKPEEKPAE